MARYFFLAFLALVCLGAAVSASCGTIATGSSAHGADDDASPSDDDASPTADDDDNDDNDDDTVQSVWADTATGLIWQNGGSVGADANYNWADAQSYCSNLHWADRTGWRLPTISELRGLIRGCADTVTNGPCGVTDSCLSYKACWSGSCIGCPNLGGPGPGGAYWSPEVTGNIGWFWSNSSDTDVSLFSYLVDFGRGYLNTSYVESKISVRCVR